METARCPACGQGDVRVRKDQTLYAHQVDGVRCEGSGQAPADAAAGQERAPEPAQAESRPSMPPTGGPPPETTTDREAATTPPDAGPRGFRWRVTVKYPCPYLKDAAWHQANGRMAAKRAVQAGRVVTGEPAHTGTEYGWDTVTLTYTVPTR